MNNYSDAFLRNLV